MTPRNLPLLALFLAAPLAAQAFQETFNYPDGPVVPGWTAKAGTWAIKNGRLVATSGGVWAYITKDGLTAKNCVLEAEFFDGGQGVEFGGLTARHPGTGGTNLVMCKIQSNGTTVPGLDRCFIYEQPGTNMYKDIPGGTASAWCRMIVLDNQVWMETDANKDGVYELSIGPYPLLQVLGSGLVGMNGYQTTEMDNFRFYDAVLMELPGNVPKIGAAYKMQFRTPPPAGPPYFPYFIFASLGNRGIPILERRLPLTADLLFTMCFAPSPVFSQFSGLLDTNGSGFPVFNIPNDPVLAGLGVFFAGFSIDPLKPFTIGFISNEHYVKIQP